MHEVYFNKMDKREAVMLAILMSCWKDFIIYKNLAYRINYANIFWPYKIFTSKEKAQFEVMLTYYAIVSNSL